MKHLRPVILLILYCVFCMVLTPSQASAYIDPGTTSAVAAAVVGMVVAIAAGVSVYWRKARKKISKAVGREEATRDESDNLEDL